MARDTILYVAKYGDYLVAIAKEHGTTWQEIWKHPLNAGHRAKRGSPDVLFPGDELHIPVVHVPPPIEPPPPVVPPPPPIEPPEVPPETPPRWPYDPPTHVEVETRPTWACPDGTCTCRPNKVEATVKHFVFLHDDRSRRMAGALCRAHVPGIKPLPVIVADSAGVVELTIPISVVALLLEWGPTSPIADPRLPYRRVYRIDTGDGIDAVERQLEHVGVSSASTLSCRVYDFQMTYGLAPSDGNPESIAPILDDYHSKGCLPPLPEEGASLVPNQAKIDSAMLLGRA